jgi:hypothetical protein
MAEEVSSVAVQVAVINFILQIVSFFIMLRVNEDVLLQSLRVISKTLDFSLSVG